MQDLFRGFPIVVVPSVGPRVVGRINAFPHTFNASQGNFHVAKGLVIAKVVSGSTGHQRVGLVLANDFHQLLNVLFWHLSGSVKPNQFNLAVLRSDLFNLREALVDKVIVERGFVSFGVNFWATISAREGPVLIVRVVESESQPSFTAGRRKVFHGVFLPWSGVHNIEAVSFGVVHCKTVMVFCSNDDVFHPRVFGGLDNRLGVEFLWVELVCQLFVFFDGNASHPRIHDPFANSVVGPVVDFVCQLRVEAPVDEHGVVAFVEKLTALSIFRSQLDDAFAPKLIHVLCPKLPITNKQE